MMEMERINLDDEDDFDKRTSNTDRALTLLNVVVNHIAGTFFNFLLCLLSLSTFSLIRSGAYSNTPLCRSTDISRLLLVDASINFLALLIATTNTCVSAMRYRQQERSDSDSDSVTHAAGTSIRFCLNLLSLCLVIPVTSLYLRSGASCKSVLSDHIVHMLNAYVAISFISLVFTSLLGCLSFTIAAKWLMSAFKKGKYEQIGTSAA